MTRRMLTLAVTAAVLAVPASAQASRNVYITNDTAANVEMALACGCQAVHWTGHARLADLLPR